MKLVQGILGGTVAGVIGALIWAAVVHFTNYEVGIIAWGIGAMVGFGVLIGSGREGGVPLGVAAAALSIGAIVLGKWMWVQFAFASPGTDEIVISEMADNIIEERIEAGQPAPRVRSIGPDDPLRSMYPRDIWAEAEVRWNQFTADEQALYRSAPTLMNSQLHLSFIADDVCEELIDQGRELNWPSGHDLSTAWRRSHYPSDVWTEAEHRWNDFTPAEQEQFMQWLTQNEQAFYGNMMSAVRPAFFLNSFGLFDLLWVVLAVATGFKIAAAGDSESAYEAA